MTIGEILDRKFDIGDTVVHPQHGVGYVAGLEEKQFEPNAPRLYYVIAIPDTTLWVPVDSTVSSGLRKLCVRSELDQCRQVLQSAPNALTPDRDLLAGLAGRIKQGTIIAHCEVVRDLTAHARHKSLYGPTADFQRIILNVLCQEWALVEGISQAEASHEISVLLKNGRTTHKQ